MRLAAHTLRAALRRTAGLASRARSRVRKPAATQPIASVPRVEKPEVSLILPVHSQPELTAACVRAIVATATVPYELIVVDDTATPATKAVVASIQGAVVEFNDANLGYTRSLNRGAALARGEFAVFLNDDTEPRPGWLEAMVDCARSSDDVGVVVPKYLQPDGSLSEAGSIVWRDGSGWNFGRGDSPDRSRYCYRRDVDYGSGACLLVRTDLLRELGGLDERFAPAYYEDVDLCFAAREAGWRVVYEPRAVVVHVEGATAGTDLSSGTKRFQVINHDRFVEKWGHRLAEQPEPGSDPRRASGRWRGPHVLVAGESDRVVAIARAFRLRGCPVTLSAADGERTDLEAEGVEVLRGGKEHDADVADLAPHLALAVLSGAQIASRLVVGLRQLAPQARIVFDAPEVGSTGALRELELEMVRSCDVTLAVTERQRQQLLEVVPDADVVVSPEALLALVP